ncbi:MAG: SPFH/Band 7/PHB domain protein, partial [Clostridia bacterium]|nr:SPFH/Band 7/PHB domain protein [Clostridia bacterium]
MPYVIIALVAVLFLLIITNIHIVPQAQAMVIERLGAYHATWTTGLHFKLPFIDRIAKRINLMEQVADFPPQPVITKDNVRMQIDSVVFFQITDCKLYAYGHTTPMAAIENLTA